MLNRISKTWGMPHTVTAWSRCWPLNRGAIPSATPGYSLSVAPNPSRSSRNHLRRFMDAACFWTVPLVCGRSMAIRRSSRMSAASSGVMRIRWAIHPCSWSPDSFSASSNRGSVAISSSVGLVSIRVSVCGNFGSSSGRGIIVWGKGPGPVSSYGQDPGGRFRAATDGPWRLGDGGESEGAGVHERGLGLIRRVGRGVRGADHAAGLGQHQVAAHAGEARAVVNPVGETAVRARDVDEGQGRAAGGAGQVLAEVVPAAVDPLNEG